ncbi:MAG TPA: hypothetical protein PKA06_16295 [Gemmatales bacterium]|nr:hypothetical protein [Gemmatales bacterium]HMP15547.1 hypothetical protein [Gemmatales bacterium]
MSTPRRLLTGTMLILLMGLLVLFVMWLQLVPADRSFGSLEA